ncbi:MAG: phosphatase PAP2 family protein [Bacteroidales bacterium]|nr:phosphatase PAP2 family protein [Bacteroidales bacterium]
MKKYLMLVVAALMATMNAGAQDETVQPYFELSELPELLEIMPEPPAFESPEFANDIVRYGWGKLQRQDPDRLALAIADAEWDNLTMFFGQYAEAFGLTITPEDTPEIYKLLVNSLATTDPMRKKCKAYYGRQRPFERFDDTMPSNEEEELRGEGSYPSGHSLRGWGIALLLAQIAPARANEIFRRGWDYCNSRVIVGAHWQSDVDASRTAASIGFCALQGSPAFREQMEKAQYEYAVKTGQVVEVDAVAAAAPAPTKYIFRIDGTRAIEQTPGIKVQNGRKYATQ